MTTHFLSKVTPPSLTTGPTLWFVFNKEAILLQKTHYYPKLSPSVIVAIVRGSEILLAQPHFAPGYYSVLAGFVEPGETAEETVAREVMEEVGINVKNI